MSHDPSKVVPFRKRGRSGSRTSRLLIPTPLDSDAGEPLPRGKKLYGQVPLEWLRDRALDRDLSCEMRLYQYLQIKSRRGTRGVRATNEMAAEVGLDRHQKARALRVLEARGWVAVTRNGRRIPVVMVRSLPPVK